MNKQYLGFLLPLSNITFLILGAILLKTENGLNNTFFVASMAILAAIISIFSVHFFSESNLIAKIALYLLSILSIVAAIIMIGLIIFAFGVAGK
jgi:hypothetical protein